MKGIVITTKDEVLVQDFSEPLYQSLNKAVGGYIEHVRPMRLKAPYCMVANEEGQLIGLPENNVGSYLYGTDRHGNTIVGNIVIMKDGYNADGEPDIVGLDDTEASDLLLVLTSIVERIRDTVFAHLMERIRDTVFAHLMDTDCEDCEDD